MTNATNDGYPKKIGYVYQDAFGLMPRSMHKAAACTNGIRNGDGWGQLWLIAPIEDGVATVSNSRWPGQGTVARIPADLIDLSETYLN